MMGTNRGNRAAIFDNRIWEGFRQPPKIMQAGRVRMSVRPAKRALQNRNSKPTIGSPPDDKDHRPTSPHHRILQNKPTKPAPIQQKFSTEPTVWPVLNPDA